jgi:hypothetical protein
LAQPIRRHARGVFNSAPIPWDVHERWFNDALHATTGSSSSSPTKMPVGTARLDLRVHEAAVSTISREMARAGVSASWRALPCRARVCELEIDHLLASVERTTRRSPLLPKQDSTGTGSGPGRSIREMAESIVRFVVIGTIDRAAPLSESRHSGRDVLAWTTGQTLPEAAAISGVAVSLAVLPRRNAAPRGLSARPRRIM